MSKTSKSKQTVKSRKGVYALVSALMFVLVFSIFLFTKIPPEKHYTREEMFDMVSASLGRYGDEDTPAGYEKVAEVLIDADFNGIYEVYREYKKGDKYDVKMYFTDKQFRITPVDLDLITNPDTQECLLSTWSLNHQPVIFIKETLEDSVTYDAFIVNEDGRKVLFSFAEKTQNGVKTYFYNGDQIPEEEYNGIIESEYTFARFHEADEILLEGSYRMVWKKQ